MRTKPNAWMYQLLPADLKAVAEESPYMIELCVKQAEDRLLEELSVRNQLKEATQLALKAVGIEG